MKKIIFFLIIISSVITSCQRLLIDDGTSIKIDEDYKLVVNFQPSSITTTANVTRNLSPSQESIINDLNLYAVQSQTGMIRHIFIEGYLTGSISLPPGNWKLYAIANIGNDMGERTPDDIEQLFIDVRDGNSLTPNERIIMTAQKKVVLEGATSIVMTMVRMVSKLQVKVSIAPNMSGRLTLNTMQLMSTPARTYLFSSQKAQSFLNYPIESISDIEFPRTYYIPENLAGIENSIIRPEDRSPVYAPQNATYILIGGTYEGQQVYYYVYPGNNTNDFNISRNVAYILDVTIVGANPSDIRVSVYDMNITPPDRQIPINETFSTELTFSAANNTDNTFQITYEVLGGDPTVTINGEEKPDGTIVYGLSGATIHERYRVEVSSNSIGPVTLKFIVKDSFGQTLAQTINIDFIPTGPLEISFEQATILKGHETPLNLIVRDPDYNGLVELTFVEVSGGGALKYNGTEISSGIKLSLNTGNHLLYYTSEGITPLSVEIMAVDSYGQQALYSNSFPITETHITFTPILKYDNIKVDVPQKGGYEYQACIDVEITSSAPVPEDYKLEFRIDYVMMSRTMTGTSPQNRYAISSVIIKAGETRGTNRAFQQQSGQGPLYDSNGKLFMNIYDIISEAKFQIFNIPKTPANFTYVVSPCIIEAGSHIPTKYPWDPDKIK